VIPVLVMALASCGGASPGASSGGGGGNNGPSSAANPSSAEATVAASGGGGQGGTTDLNALADKLTPPNATQTATYPTDTTIGIDYSSSDSLDTLKSFYDTAISDAGFTVASKIEGVAGSITWYIANDAGVGGYVTVDADPSGNGTQVTVALGPQ
jgi:hypothetical protein